MEGTQPLSTSPAEPTLGPGVRAVTVGSLVARTFELWKRNFVAFAAVAFSVHLTTLVLMWAAGSPFLKQPSRFGVVTPEGQAFVSTGRFWAIEGLALALIFLAVGALNAGALDDLGGGRARVIPMFARAVRRLPTLLGANLLALVASGIGFLLLVAPGVIVMVMYFLGSPIAVAEPVSPLGANGRSRALTKGHRWKLLAVIVILYLVSVVPAYLVGTVAGDVPYLATVLTLVANSALSPLYMVSPAVAYHDLRAAAEGEGTAELERVFS